LSRAITTKDFILELKSASSAAWIVVHAAVVTTSKAPAKRELWIGRTGVDIRCDLSASRCDIVLFLAAKVDL
jgi:hypothetical protein